MRQAVHCVANKLFLCLIDYLHCLPKMMQIIFVFEIHKPIYPTIFIQKQEICNALIIKSVTW